MGWFSALNPVNYFNTMKQDLSGTPTWGKFWDSFGANDPITHGLLNSQSRLDDNVTAKGLGALGLSGPAGYFQRAADDPTQGVLHHGLAGLAYLGGSALMSGGGLGAGAADGGSVNLFADAVPGAGGDVGASALPDVSVGTTGAGGSTATASGSSPFNWQGFARQGLSNGLKGFQNQGMQANSSLLPNSEAAPMNGYSPAYMSPQQTMARALMIDTPPVPDQAPSSMGNALLASQLLKSTGQTPTNS